jgi:hypothetical protein
MTMIDESTLIAALHSAADDLTISDDATMRILNEARSLTSYEKSHRIRTLYRYYGRGRTIALAVAAGVVAMAITVPLVQSEYGPTGRLQSFSLPAKVAHGSAVPNDPLSPQGLVVHATGARASFTIIASSSNNSLKVKEVGTIDLSVGKKNFESTINELTTMAAAFGGFVANTQVRVGNATAGTYSFGTVVLQVPQRQFTALVNHVRHIGLATSVTTSTTNVTGQYVDLRARITALEVSRQQYLKIMNRTSSIGGILAVQQQLDSIQSQIEQRQGQLNLLNNQTTYGTLTVSLTESGHAPFVPRRGSGLSRAWYDSVGGFVAGFEWLIRVAGPLLFAVICLTVLLAIGRLVWRVRQRRGT